MVSWKCPFCGQTMHSSNDSRCDALAQCIHCDGCYTNPYSAPTPSDKRRAHLTGYAITLHRHYPEAFRQAATDTILDRLHHMDDITLEYLVLRANQTAFPKRGGILDAEA